MIEEPERATPLLAVIRIICVLGMSVGIAFGLFCLLGGWWLIAIASLLMAIPFFALMAFVEKRAARKEF